jgi:hypothetical protein
VIIVAEVTGALKCRRPQPIDEFFPAQSSEQHQRGDSPDRRSLPVLHLRCLGPFRDHQDMLTAWLVFATSSAWARRSPAHGEMIMKLVLFESGGNEATPGVMTDRGIVSIGPVVKTHPSSQWSASSTTLIGCAR